MANLVNRELFAKIFLANIQKNIFGICSDFSLFAKFFLADSFHLYTSPKFSPAKFSRVQYCMVENVGMRKHWQMAYKENMDIEYSVNFREKALANGYQFTKLATNVFSYQHFLLYDTQCYKQGCIM